MKYQNKLKEIQEAGHYKVPSIFMAVALEADREIDELKSFLQQVVDIKNQKDVVRARNRAMLILTRG